MGRVLVEILAGCALFIANRVFAMTEMAFASSRKSRLKQMAAGGAPGESAALRPAQAPTRFLPTVQIGITTIGLLAGAFSGATPASAATAPDVSQKYLAQIGKSDLNSPFVPPTTSTTRPQP